MKNSYNTFNLVITCHFVMQKSSPACNDVIGPSYDAFKKHGMSSFCAMTGIVFLWVECVQRDRGNFDIAQNLMYCL